MEYIAGVTIIKSIGLDLTIKCITGLTSSAQGIYNLLTNIKTSSYSEDISKVLKELDMENDILILESLLKEINIEKHHTKTLALCLESLRECVVSIEKILIEINTRIIYNKSLWIGTSVRSYTFDDIIESLKIFNSNLNNRKKTLFEVIKINQYLNPYLDINTECDITVIEPL
jgi:hypothetical protein